MFPLADARTAFERSMARGKSGKVVLRVVDDQTSRQERKAEEFRALHAGEAFVIPNPWDAGSARVLEALGFQALATTSSGYAFTLGRLDGGATLDEVVEHTAALDGATELPLSVDLENGYGASPDRSRSRSRGSPRRARSAARSRTTTGMQQRIYERGHAVERIAAAAEAAHNLGFPFTLTARAENHIRGNPDLADTIARLQAFEEAGADVLYAPGLRSADEIRAVCQEVSRPVNVLALRGLSVAEIVAAGAQRVSVGGGLAWVAVSALADAATAIRDSGDLSSLAARSSARASGSGASARASRPRGLTRRRRSPASPRRSRVKPLGSRPWSST